MSGQVPAPPLWEACQLCENLWCNFHDCHVGECPCPRPLEMEDEPFDPYTDPPPPDWQERYGWLDEPTEEATP